LILVQSLFFSFLSVCPIQEERTKPAVPGLILIGPGASCAARIGLVNRSVYRRRQGSVVPAREKKKKKAIGG